MPISDEIAIVIPAYNAEHYLEQTLTAAVAGAKGAPVVVVDAGSTDSTGDVARSLGARVVRLPQRAGPAEARNAGVQQTSADVVLFVDADCVLHPDTVQRVADAFRDDPALVSLTGSYDDCPPAPGFFSQYMNLRHHFTHQLARREGASFWAGLGAVRREDFLAVGGFDAERFPRPQIEDIELATRLAGRGRMALDPGLRVTHLKQWSLRSVVETDIWSRAVPWTRLILERGTIPQDLNLRWSQRLAAVFAALALIALPVGLVAVVAGAYGTATLAVSCMVASAALNGPMLAFFARRRGFGFAVGAWLFHQVHLTYSAVVFTSMTLAGRLRRSRGRR